MIVIKEVEANKTWELRQRVMWPTKPIDFVKLENDDEGIHFGLFKESKMISVVSLFISGKSAQFRKLATEVCEQGNGYASSLLEYVFDYATDKGVYSIWCNARIDKLSFYIKKDFNQTSDKFSKSGIDYVIIKKALN